MLAVIIRSIQQLTGTAKTKFTIKDVYDMASGGGKLSEPIMAGTAYIEIESSCYPFLILQRVI